LKSGLARILPSLQAGSIIASSLTMMVQMLRLLAVVGVAAGLDASMPLRIGTRKSSQVVHRPFQLL